MPKADKDESENSGDWLTISEACKYLQISEQTMFRWMRSGKITYYKVGKSTRFKESDLNKAVERVASRSTIPDDINTCKACGNDDLISGSLSALGELVFKPEDKKFSVWKDTSVGVTALCCSKCGTITLRANVDDLEK